MLPAGTLPTLAAYVEDAAEVWMLVMNYIHTDFETPIIVNSHRGDEEDALNMRLQFDF